MRDRESREQRAEVTGEERAKRAKRVEKHLAEGSHELRGGCTLLCGTSL
jgi:hypothetical protein